MGDLDAIHDDLNVRDVMESYGLLLAQGLPGEEYDVHPGEGRILGALVLRLRDLVRGTCPILEA